MTSDSKKILTLHWRSAEMEPKNKSLYSSGAAILCMFFSKLLLLIFIVSICCIQMWEARKNIWSTYGTCEVFLRFASRSPNNEIKFQYLEISFVKSPNNNLRSWNNISEMLHISHKGLHMFTDRIILSKCFKCDPNKWMINIGTNSYKEKNHG